MWDSSHIHTYHTINQIGASHKQQETREGERKKEREGVKGS